MNERPALTVIAQQLKGAGDVCVELRDLDFRTKAVGVKKERNQDKNEEDEPNSCANNPVHFAIHFLTSR